jgi:hypothetical protein
MSKKRNQYALLAPFFHPRCQNFRRSKGQKDRSHHHGLSGGCRDAFPAQGAGINPDRDVSFLVVGTAPTRLAALSKGVVQSSVFIPPQDIAAEKLGLHPLIDMSQLGLYNPGSYFASTKTYIRTHRDTATRVMKAFVEGLKF